MFLIAIALVGGGYYWWQQRQNVPQFVKDGAAPVSQTLQVVVSLKGANGSDGRVIRGYLKRGDNTVAYVTALVGYQGTANLIFNGTLTDSDAIHLELVGLKDEVVLQQLDKSITQADLTSGKITVTMSL